MMSRIDTADLCVAYLKSKSPVDLMRAAIAMAQKAPKTSPKIVVKERGKLDGVVSYNLILENCICRFNDIMYLADEDGYTAMEGREEDIQAAEYMIELVFEYRDKMWDVIKDLPKSDTIKTSFMNEFYMGIKMRLDKIMEKRDIELKRLGYKPINVRKKVMESKNSKG